MTKKISLEVNGNPISLDYFVESFVDHTVRGMLQSLENTGPVNKLDLTVTEEEVDVVLNGQTVSTNKFVNKIMKTTVFGMVSPLKGVTDPVKNVKMEIEE